MAFVLYKGIQVPTGVEHCLSCHFCNENEPNLVVAKTSLLQIFRIKTIPTDDNNNPKQVLELVFEKKLFGNIESMSAVRFAGRKLDSLYLTFEAVKVSRIDFDPATNDIKTSALHYFEDPVLKEGRVQFSSKPILKVDPKQRCGAVLFYDLKLAVIPFKEEEEFDVDLRDDGKSEQNMGSYVVNLAALGIRNIKDYTFLHGFFEPTLLILYEPTPTWSGRSGFHRDSCCMAALSISTRQRTNPIVWRKDNITYESERLLPVPEPIGGVLVICPSQILYFNQSVGYMLVLNDFAKQTTNIVVPTENSGLQLTFDAAKTSFLEPDKVLFSLKNGELFLLHIMSDMKSFKGLVIDRVGSSVLTSCLCKISNNLAFFGSRLGDSLLIQYKPVASQQLEFKKQAKFEDIESNKNTQYSMLDMEEEQIYFKSNQQLKEVANTVAFVKYELKVLDSLANFGPISDMAIADSWDSTTQSHLNFADVTQKTTNELEIRACSGYAKNGSVAIIQESLRPELLFATEVPGCQGLWTLGSTDSTDPNYHSFLLISKANETMILQLGEELSEITDDLAKDFHIPGPTIDAGNLLNNRIVQVYKSGIILIQGRKKVFEQKIEEEIIAASISDPYVAIICGPKKNVIVYQALETNFLKQLEWDSPSQNLPISAACLFEDENSFFSKTVTSAPVLHTSPSKISQMKVQASIEDEDMLLYGSAEKQSVPEMKEEAQTPPSLLEEITKRTYCSLVRENGRFELYQLPEFKLVFSTGHFNCYPQILANVDLQLLEQTTVVVKKEATQQSFFAQEKMGVSMPEPIVTDIEIQYLDNISEPFIFGVTNHGDFFMYRGFYYADAQKPFRFAI